MTAIRVSPMLHNQKTHSTKRESQRRICTSLASSRFLQRCMFLFAGTGLYAAETAVSQGSEPIYWSRNEFVIPFQVDSNGQAPQEVQLEVSEDSGQNWSQYSRGDSRTRQFQYKAVQDGEYQFRLKTIDSSGRRFNNPGEPLRIVIDTTKPIAKLVVGISPRGEMLAEFLVADAALDTDSIALEYQTEEEPKWLPIKFELTKSTTPGEYAGYGSWNLSSQAKQLVVRLAVKDKAGNTAEDTRLPALPKTANLQHGLQFASQSIQTQASPQSSAMGSDRNSPSLENGASPVGNQSPFGGRPGTLTAPSSASKNMSNEGASGIVLGPLPNGGNNGVPVRELSENEIEAYRNRDGIRFTGAKSEPNSLGDLGNGMLDGGPSSLRMEQGISSPNNSGSELTSLPRLSAPRRTSTSSKAGLDPLYSNTRVFSLDYRIENDPGAPITEVELWGTADQGRTWEPWGLDPDRKSPFDIEVEGDGLFGFRMVIVGANGLASNRPRNGDDADAWIQVDTVKPHARVTSALYGKGQEAGSLVIEYTVSDDFLPERPISLFYADTPHGPWETISRGVRNQGRFVWPSNPNLPPKIYLRIEATDLAGNVSGSILDLPIDVEGIAPRGRIQGFRPLGRPGE